MIIGALPEAFAAFAETVDEVMKPWHRQYRRCRRSAQMHYGHELGGRLVREFMNNSPDARDVWALPEAIAEAAHGQPVSTDGLTSEAVASIEVADSVREAAREAARRAVDLIESAQDELHQADRSDETHSRARCCRGRPEHDPRRSPIAAHAPPAESGTRPATPSMAWTGTDLGYRSVRAQMSQSSPTSPQREG